jgi:Zn-dependent alcohol dehydrogenase
MGLGHEVSGVVTHVGKEVTHVKEGDHVISTWFPGFPLADCLFEADRGDLPWPARHR